MRPMRTEKGSVVFAAALVLSLLALLFLTLSGFFSEQFSDPRTWEMFAELLVLFLLLFRLMHLERLISLSAVFAAAVPVIRVFVFLQEGFILVLLLVAAASSALGRYGLGRLRRPALSAERLLPFSAGISCALSASVSVILA